MNCLSFPILFFFAKYQSFFSREEMFKENLARLKNDIVRANALAREANMIAAELSHSRRQVSYDVTLQIPAANLRPSKIKVILFTISILTQFFDQEKRAVIFCG